jgi:hypothetical protein
LCNDDCGPFASTDILKSGQSVSVGEDPDGIFRPVEVLSRSKNILGCLPFQFSKAPPANTVVNVSRMVRCGNSVGAKQSGGRDWPFS